VSNHSLGENRLVGSKPVLVREPVNRKTVSQGESVGVKTDYSIENPLEAVPRREPVVEASLQENLFECKTRLSKRTRWKPCLEENPFLIKTRLVGLRRFSETAVLSTDRRRKSSRSWKRSGRVRVSLGAVGFSQFVFFDAPYLYLL
jgi:hypothetical protein